MFIWYSQNFSSLGNAFFSYVKTTFIGDTNLNARETLYIAEQEKNFEIQLPSGPVHFSFQLPPLNYHLPNKCVMFIPYQQTRLLRLISLAHRTTNLPFSLSQE